MMNKIKIIFFNSFVFLCLFLISNSFAVQQSNGFQDYRFNPFQFPYPEYEYTAKQIIINKTSRSEKDLKIIDCFGVSIAFSKEFFDHVDQKSKSRLLIKSKNNNAIVVNFENENLMGCSDETERNNNKDFCSAFSSTEDFYNKLFSLTPEDLSNDQFLSTGYKWIVHRKGQMFNRVSEIMVYKGNDYSVYRTDIKDDEMSIKSELFIFPESIKPNYLILSMNFKDDNVIKTIVSSIK